MQYCEDIACKKKVGAPKWLTAGGWHLRPRKTIAILDTKNMEGAASTLVHETVHASQYDRMSATGTTMTKYEKEREAWIQTQNWRLARGLGTRAKSWTKKNPVTGKDELNVTELLYFVKDAYGVDASGKSYHVKDVKLIPRKQVEIPVTHEWKCPCGPAKKP